MADSILNISTGASTPEDEAEVRFQFDGEGQVLVARRPKSLLLVHMARVVRGNDIIEQAGVLEDFIDAVLDEDSAKHVRQRLLDPDDYLDLDHLVPLVDMLKERWFARPTGKPTASSGPPQRRGRSSTGRVRSTG